MYSTLFKCLLTPQTRQIPERVEEEIGCNFASHDEKVLLTIFGRFCDERGFLEYPTVTIVREG